MAAVSAVQVSDVLKGLTLPQLRQQLRSRGLNPAGGQETLQARLGEHMLDTQDLSLASVTVPAAEEAAGDGLSVNNYARPGGNQNLGNRVTERPSSRVLAPPGGVSQIALGGDRAAGRATQAPGSLVSSAGRVLNVPGPDDPIAPPTPASPNKKFNNLSQVAFGDHQLPSYVKQHGDGSTAPKAAAQVVQENLELRVDTLLKPLMLKDLRDNLRARGLSPAGGAASLRTRLAEHMVATQDLELVGGDAHAAAPALAAVPTGPHITANTDTLGSPGPDGNRYGNNYSRPGGAQNVGNFITDRPTSRVLAPPGGRSQITFG